MLIFLSVDLESIGGDREDRTLHRGHLFQGWYPGYIAHSQAHQS